MSELTKYANPEKPKPYAVRGYTRITILLLHNFAEISFWFSISYIYFDGSFLSNNAPLNTITALTFSFSTMTTFGNSQGVTILGSIGNTFNLIQAVIGVFMILLILARFIALIPRAPTSDSIEQKMNQ